MCCSIKCAVEMTEKVLLGYRALTMVDPITSEVLLKQGVILTSQFEVSSRFFLLRRNFLGEQCSGIIHMREHHINRPNSFHSMQYINTVEIQWNGRYIWMNLIAIVNYSAWLRQNLHHFTLLGYWILCDDVNIPSVKFWHFIRCV